MDQLSAAGPLPPLAEAFLEFKPGAYRLGELLVSQGACTADDVSSALERQKKGSVKIGVLLVEAGACSRTQVEEALAWQSLARAHVWDQLGRLAWHPRMQATRTTEAGSPIVVAGVPGVGSFVRFSPLEYALADLMTRCRTYPELLEAAWSACAMLVSPQQVVELSDRLAAAGLLIDPEDPAAPRARRSWQDLALVRKPLADPTRLLRALHPLLKLLSSRLYVLAVWLPMLALASWLAATRWPQIAPEFDRLATLREPVTLLLLTFVSTGLHEFGHAAVCGVLGAPVTEAGVMLYLGMPFGYCDVTAAHLLARKRDRIAVSLGGLYYQVGLSVAGMIAWGYLPLPAWAQTLALQVAIVSGGSIVFDLNPFAKLDGYYILSDLVEIPNLRARSFAYLAARLLGRKTEPLTGRERAIFLAYGLVGSLVTLALLALGVLWWRQLLVRLFHV